MRLAVIKGFEAKLDYGQLDLLQRGDYGFTSEVRDLYDQLNVEDHVEFVTFDVGDGKQWLSSRLYLFTIILQEIHSLRCIVFVGKYHDTKYHVIGSVTPKDVRYTLARKYPWLKSAFVTAYGFLKGSGEISGDGVLDKRGAIKLVDKFLEDPKIRWDKQRYPSQSQEEWMYLEYTRI